MKNDTVDLTESLWFWVRDEAMLCKPHACPRSLLTPLLAELQTRSPGSKFDVRPMAEMTIDLPGMVFADRGYQTIRLDMLDIMIPYHDFALMTALFQDHKLRTFADGSEYYKFHGWMRCLVLNPEQAQELLKTMNEIKSACELRAQEEHVVRLRKIDGIAAIDP